jgi:hypothetical protein
MASAIPSPIRCEIPVAFLIWTHCAAAMSINGMLGYYAIRGFFNAERLAWFVRTILVR